MEKNINGFLKNRPIRLLARLIEYIIRAKHLRGGGGGGGGMEIWDHAVKSNRNSGEGT